jgi:hypothetical protein
MIKALCLACLLVAPVFAGERAIGEKEIFTRIKRLNPQVELGFGHALAKAIGKYAKKFHMNPFRSVAIAFQESRLRNINRTEEMYSFRNVCNEKSAECHFEARPIVGATDVGVFQFHIKTILRFGLDPVRLFYDLDYATLSHFRILKEKLKECGRLGAEWWSCWHSITPDLRQKYVVQVNKYML